MVRVLSKMLYKFHCFAFVSFKCVSNRYISDAQFYISIANCYIIIYGANMTALSTIPWFRHALTALMWYPFDPYQNAMTFHLAQFFESLWGSCCGATNVAINMYMFVVFVSINFYYSLMSERATQIGYHLDQQPKPTKIEIYQQMIELITIHLKINK